MGDVLTYINNNRDTLALLISCLSLFVAGLTFAFRLYDVHKQNKRGLRLLAFPGYDAWGEEALIVEAISNEHRPIVVRRICVALKERDIPLAPGRGSRIGDQLGFNESAPAIIPFEQLRLEVFKSGRATHIYAEDNEREQYKYRRAGFLARLPNRLLPGLLLPDFLRDGIYAKRPWRLRDRRPRLEPPEVLLRIKSVDEYKRQIADHFAPLVDAETLSVYQIVPESPEEAEGLRRLLSDRMYLLTLDKDILADKGKIDKACASKASAHPDRADRIKAERAEWSSSYEELREHIQKRLMPALEAERVRLWPYTQPLQPAARTEEEVTEVDRPADPDNPPTGATHET